MYVIFRTVNWIRTKKNFKNYIFNNFNSPTKLNETKIKKQFIKYVLQVVGVSNWWDFLKTILKLFEIEFVGELLIQTSSNKIYTIN